MFITFFSCLIVLYFIVLFFWNGGVLPSKAPKHYRGWIPFVGVAPEIASMTLAGLVEKYSKENEGIFTVHIFGNNHTYITDPEIYPTIWKDSKVGFGPIVHRIADRLRGFSEGENLTNEELEEKSEISRKNSVSNLMGEELNKITIKYQHLADQKIDELTKGKSKLGLLDFTQRVIYTASSKSLLEERFDSEGTIKDFFYFDKNSKLLIAGFPERFLPKVVEARSNVLKEVAKMDLTKTSMFLQGLKFQSDDQKVLNSKAMNLLFASQTNSVNSSFWLLLYVLKHKDVKEKIIKELEFYDPNDIKSIEKMETLNNSFWEAARLADNHLSFREALEDVKVKVYGKEYVIPKGNAIMMWPTSLLDERVFEDPLEFKPDRHKNLSKQAKQAFIPFGGGKHLCPGRYFAMNEAKLFTISMLQKFEIDLDNTEFPKPIRDGGGFLFPDRDISILFKPINK